MTHAPRLTPDVDGALRHLEQFLQRAKPGFENDARLVDEARALSVAYTEPVSGAGTTVGVSGGKPGGNARVIADDAAGSLAYLAYFGPRAVVATSRAIAALPADSGGHVVDVGAGSGASALAWQQAGARQVVLVERSGAALDIANKLLGSGNGRSFTTRKALATDISPIVEASIVAASFTIGEWRDDVDIRAVLQRIAPRARDVVVVDAGDHARSRRLQALRDSLVGAPPQDGAPAVAGGSAVVVYGPCGHRDACPALVRARDWCHDRVEKRLPPALARFAQNVGRDDRWMSLSWLAWGNDPGVPVAKDAVVVIGEGIKDKGRARLPVCGPGGLRFVQALKRDRAAHDAVLELARGARLAVPPEGTGDIWHVSDVSVFGEVTNRAVLPTFTPAPKTPQTLPKPQKKTQPKA